MTAGFIVVRPLSPEAEEYFAGARPQWTTEYAAARRFTYQKAAEMVAAVLGGAIRAIDE